MYALGKGLPAHMFHSQGPVGAVDSSIMLYRPAHPQIQQVYYPVMQSLPPLVSVVPSLEQQELERAQQFQHWKNGLPPDMVSPLSEDNSMESPNPLLFFSEVVRSPVSSPPEYILLLSNVPAGLGADQIHDTFEVFGKIVYCRMLLNSAPINDCKYAHSPDCCVIVFKSPESVKTAASYNELIILSKPVYLHSIDANGVSLANLKSVSDDVEHTEPAKSQPMEKSEQKEMHNPKPHSADLNSVDTKETVSIEYTFEHVDNEQKTEGHVNELIDKTSSIAINEGAFEAKSTESKFEPNGRNSNKKIQPKAIKSSHDEPTSESKVSSNTSVSTKTSITNLRQKTSRQIRDKKKKSVHGDSDVGVGDVYVSSVRKGNTLQNKPHSHRIGIKAQNIITRNTAANNNKHRSKKVEMKDTNFPKPKSKKSSTDKVRVVDDRKQGIMEKKKNKAKGKGSDKKSRKDKKMVQRSSIDNVEKSQVVSRKKRGPSADAYCFESLNSTAEHGTMLNQSAKATSKMTMKKSKSKSLIDTSPVKSKRNTAKDITPPEDKEPAKSRIRNSKKLVTKRHANQAEVEKKMKMVSKRSPGKLVFGSTEDCDYVDSSALKGRYVFGGKTTATSNSHKTQYKRNQNSTLSHATSSDVTEGKSQGAGRIGTHPQKRKQQQSRRKGRKIMIF